MIDVREPTVPPSGDQIPGVAGRARLGEVPDVLLLTIGDDRGTPASAIRIPGNSYAARTIVALAASVARVLSRARCAEVLAPVVERIPVDVIDLLSRPGAHDGPVQVDVAIPVLARRHTGVMVAPLEAGDLRVVPVTDDRDLPF